MKALHLIIGSFLTLACVCQAEVSVPEFQTLRAAFDRKVQSEILGPYQESMSDLNTKYIMAIDRAVGTFQQAGKLDDVLALNAEKAIIGSPKGMPVEDDPKSLISVKQLRVTYRSALVKIRGDSDKKYKLLRDSFQKSLSDLVVTLTKNGNLDGAIFVKKSRDEMPASPIAAPQPTAPPSAEKAKPEVIGGDWGQPFKEKPNGAKLVGFNITYDKDKGNTVIQSVQPIWNSGSEFKGHTYGKPMGAITTVKAKDGYAVGAMEGRGGTRVDVIQLTYMKVKLGGLLDPSDSYKSEWYGGKQETTKILSGGGLPVIGIIGGSGGSLNSLGLVFQTK